LIFSFLPFSLPTSFFLHRFNNNFFLP